MKLSENFSLNELTKSQTATRRGISNQPSGEHLENLKALVEKVLQPIRDSKGQPIRVTSGYRSSELNTAIGGSSKSQHSKGEAADFEITGVDNYELAEWIKSFIPEFDQLILEFYTSGDQNSGWIHCSYSREKNRKQILTASKENGKTVYNKGLVT
jgi:zinc D-Ala-D-Ala carboxypeptidase